MLASRVLGVMTAIASAVCALGAEVVEAVRTALGSERPHQLPPHDDPRRVTRYTDAVLDPLRKIGDPLTDDLMSRIAASGGAGDAAQAKAVHGFYETLLDSPTRVFDIGAYANRPYAGVLRDWAHAIVLPPPDMTAQLVRAGEFFRQNLFRIVVILSTSSLLEAFACANGVRVLASTKYLSKNTNRRLYETLQFVLQVNEPEGFTSGNAVKAIQRVRLMHGCIRWILEHTGKWDADAWGLPINQHDLLGMLMGFSGVVIRDLPKLDADVSTDQAIDHIVLWNVVGKLLGAPMQHRPETIGEALALIHAIERRDQRPSPDGERMTDALIAFHREKLGPLFDSVGIMLMRRLAGDHICDMLGVPWGALAGARVASDLIVEPLTFWGQYLVFGGGGADRPPYEIPTSLQPLWAEVTG